jgi:hypothetical protein
MKLGTSEELQMKQLFTIVQVFYSTQKQVHTHSIFYFKRLAKKNNVNILIYIFVFLSYSPFFRYSSNTNINTNNNAGKKNLLSEGVLSQAGSTSVTEVVLVAGNRHPFARKSRGGLHTFVSLVHASPQACCLCSPTLCMLM